jgi:hypothetical protein
MPIYHVEVRSVADFTTVYEVEADNEEEAENNYSDGNIVSQDYEDDMFTDNVENVTKVGD